MTTLWGETAGLPALEQRALSHGRMYVVPAGAAPSVLFVHGGFHGAWCWRPTIAYLAARGIRSAAVDLRGHGGLPQDETYIAQGVEAMTQDVLEAGRMLAEDYVLAGHSVGALIAMKAAMDRKPRGRIRLAPAAPGNVPAGHALPRFPATRAVQAPGEERARKWFLSGSSSPDIGAYLSLLCPESPRLLNECFHDGVAVDPAAISVPTLCISGAKDESPLHRRAQDRAIAEMYGAELRTVPRSGHCMMLDDGWEDTAREIHDWLTTRTSPSPTDRW